MSFLNKIDTMHTDCQSEYCSEELSKSFSTYISVEPVGISLTKQFMIQKQEKTKLLLVSEKQRVYLSDYQILSTILHMDKDLIDWFIRSFIELYKGNYKNFKFKVADEEFNGIGIGYYPSPKEILLFSDTKIDINDFIFVLNFVFSKDYQWEKDILIEDFSKRTIVKYITLLDYYANNSERSKEFLEKIGYPLSATEFIDIPKTKNMFDKTNLFDISKFL